MQHTLTFITETKHCCKTMLTPSLCVMHSVSTLFHQKFFSGDPLNWFQSSQVMAYILETCSKGSMWVQESSGRGWTSQNASLPCSLPVWVCIFSFWLSAMKRNYRPNRSWRSVGGRRLDEKLEGRTIQAARLSPGEWPFEPVRSML